MLQSPMMDSIRSTEDGFVQVLKELKAGLKQSSDQTTARKLKATG